MQITAKAMGWKKNSLVDDNTVCFCDRGPHFSIHLSTYFIKHIVSSQGKWTTEWYYTVTVPDGDLLRNICGRGGGEGQGALVTV